jgi:hypothetical protein
MRYCQPITPAKFAQFTGSNFQEIIELVTENSNYSVLANKEKCVLYTDSFYAKTCKKDEYLIWLDLARGFTVLSEDKFKERYKEEKPEIKSCRIREEMPNYSPRLQDMRPGGFVEAAEDRKEAKEEKQTIESYCQVDIWDSLGDQQESKEEDQ